MKSIRKKVITIKDLTLILLLGVSLLASCTDDTPKVEDQILGTWNLNQVTGGILGLDCMFDSEDVTWTFTESKIEIEANNISISLCPVIDNSDHSYTILYSEDTPFMIRDNQEFGLVTITESVVDEVTIENLSIDGGVLSTGTVNDEFVFSLSRPKQ